MGQSSTFPPAFLNISKYIRTGESTVPQSVNPVGTRAFRKNITSSCGKCATCATIVIVSDESNTVYVNYVNGQAVGSGANLRAYSIPKLNPTLNTFAVGTTNNEGPAGLIATIHITYRDGTSQTIVTDGSWKAAKTLPEGFQEVFFDDSNWKAAKVDGKYGIKPWGKLTIPRA